MNSTLNGQCLAAGAQSRSVTLSDVGDNLDAALNTAQLNLDLAERIVDLLGGGEMANSIPKEDHSSYIVAGLHSRSRCLQDILRRTDLALKCVYRALGTEEKTQEPAYPQASGHVIQSPHRR